MVGNYCPGVRVNITLFLGDRCVDKKVGNMAKVWDSEELGNRTKTVLHVSLHCTCKYLSVRYLENVSFSI